MAENSKIEWTHHTFNPWTGCTKVSPGCDNCYAESWAKRSGLVKWGPSEERRRTSEDYWRQPIKWNRIAERDGVRRKVFCASLADVFDNQVPVEWRADLWRLIEATPHLDWLLLTKRPQNAGKMILAARRAILPAGAGMDDGHFAWPWPNVWLGTTVENQEEADRRIPHLLAVPAAVRFLSCEPLLEELRLDRVAAPKTAPDDEAEGWKFNCLSTGDYYSLWDEDPLGPGLRCVDSGDGPYREARIDWVIAGGESGPGARPMHPTWARSLCDQCSAAGVPFFFKQWGEWSDCTDMQPVPKAVEDLVFTASGHVVGAGGGGMGTVEPDWREQGAAWMCRVGKKKAGHLLDGQEWRQFPSAGQ